MIKLIDFKQVLLYLNNGVQLYLKDKTEIIKKDNLIIISKNSNRLRLNINDFIDLYQKEEFYYTDETDAYIDMEKDLEYYAFKHK